MPQDNRRIQGPENTQLYELHTSQPSEGSKVKVDDGQDKQAELRGLFRDGKRNDGRSFMDVRQIFMKTGVISHAKGSAYVEQNETKVICAVYGPQEIPKKSDFSFSGQLYCEFKFASFSCKIRRGHQQDEEERELSLLLQQTLESAVCLHQFPKSQVNVFVMVLENDGSTLAAAITCSGLALADAGIQMYDLITGACLRCYGDHIMLDPTWEEEYHPAESYRGNIGIVNHGNMTIGFLPSLHQVSAFLQEGNMDLETVTSGMKMLTETCTRIYPLVQNCLIKSVKHSLKSKS